MNTANAITRCGPRGQPPNPQAARMCRRRQPLRHRALCGACGRFGHEETRCEFLAMCLYCKKYMVDKTKQEVKLVFDHWSQMNRDYDQDPPAYDDIQRNVSERGVSIRRLSRSMDWSLFEPLTQDECFQIEEEAEDSSEDSKDD